MKIKKVKTIENGVMINDSLSLPNSSTGHIRDSYNGWLADGNKPSAMDKVDPWPQIRAERDGKINAVQFEYDRNARELRLNVTPTRPAAWVAQLDQYVQDLADIPQTYQNNPDGVVFPQLPA